MWESRAVDARPAADCPEPERLWNAARGALPPAETRALVDHTASCAACAEGWRLAASLAPAAVRPARTRFGARRAALLGAAAATVLALVLVPSLMRDDLPPGADLRGQAASLRSLISETEPLSREACILEWSAGPEGSRYAIEVASERLALLSQADGLETNRYQVPQEALAALPAGARLVWRVQAHLPDGATIAGGTFLATLE
jgi:hypothetical protein